METTIKISDTADLNINLLNQIIKDITNVSGEVEITIKSRKKLNPELLRRIEDTEKGAELLIFNSDEFDTINEKLLKGEKIDKSTMKKVKKDEEGNILSD